MNRASNSSKKRKYLETFRLDIRNIWCRIIFTFPTCWRPRICVLFSQKNSCDQSKYFQNSEACLSKEWILFHRVFCILGNWLTFQNPQTLSRKKQSLHHEKDYHRLIRWIFLLKFLYGWDFPPHTKCTQTRGRLFWGGYVYNGGCLSNLMNAYRRNLFSIQNINWISSGFYYTKRLKKRYTVARLHLRFNKIAVFSWR